MSPLLQNILNNALISLMRKHSAVKSKAYTSFVYHRDKALEAILTTAQQRINDELRRVFTRAVEIVSFRYSSIAKDSLLTYAARHALSSISNAIDQEFVSSASIIGDIIVDLKKKSYRLASAGEAKAIALASGKETDEELPHKDDSELNAMGENIYERTYLSLSRINRDIADAIELSRINREDHPAALRRVLNVLPDSRTIVQPKKVLKKVQEAQRDVELTLNTDDSEWDDLISDYMDEYVPQNRGPEAVYDITPPGEPSDYSEEWYQWEMEQSITHDFVASVRDGQNDAAKENGVTDFQWIAIIDDKTDECCAWRDGLTSTEIQDKLDGEHADDESDAIVPPAHFNCRCTIAPVLEDMPDAPASNEEEFDQWLNS